MATDLANLQTRRSAIYAELAAIQGGASPNGVPGSLPDASGAGSIGHVAYKKALYQELSDINNIINIADGPWELEIQGRG